MATKMLKVGVGHHLIVWVTDFLVGIVQSVRCYNDRTGLIVFLHQDQSVQVRPRVQLCRQFITLFTLVTAEVKTVVAA